MTKPTVTEKALSKALDAYNRVNTTEGMSQEDAMRAAITAAIEASGLVEENARLRDAAKVALNGFTRLVDFTETTDFDHEIAILERAIKKDTTL